MRPPVRLNVAIAGGSCTGKSTLAAALFAQLKERGADYDLVTEESRKLRREFGYCRSPFDRLYLWRQQEREELRSTALEGFITDTPLFHMYVQARQHVKEPRDLLAVRELFRMCLEIEDRYQLIVIAEDPFEIPYKTDQSRQTSEEESRRKHALIRSFVEHFWPDKLLFVKGSVAERVALVLAKLETMRKA
ncbi:MAG: AAA family ATPase [Candidatus Liptonbacteria bacterium]|nr:AAA family ATPase [Candidatus Liptonbacteria bacterium]